MTHAKATSEQHVYDVAKTRDGFALRRNNAVLTTPAEAEFVLPTKALAEVVAAEWPAFAGAKHRLRAGRQAQGKKPDPASMPLTQLAATAIDIVPKERSKIVDQIVAYAETELLCHRAEAPPELVEQQQATWQPILDWCMERFDAVLMCGPGIMPIAQQPDAINALRHVVEGMDHFRLTGLQQAVHVSGSLVLGLALAERHLNAAQVFDAAELDASFQIEKWGEDPALAHRHEHIKCDLAVCEQWFRLLA